MGKRSAASPDGRTAAAKAKTENLLQCAFRRGAASPVLSSFEAWKETVLKESTRAYYTQRSDFWMQSLWEKAKVCAAHSLAEDFLIQTTSIPEGKTPWAFNPKEICAVFDTFVQEKSGAAAESSPASEGAGTTATAATVAEPPLQSDADTIATGSPIKDSFMDVAEEKHPSLEPTAAVKDTGAGEKDEPVATTQTDVDMLTGKSESHVGGDAASEATLPHVEVGMPSIEAETQVDDMPTGKSENHADGDAASQATLPHVDVGMPSIEAEAHAEVAADCDGGDLIKPTGQHTGEDEAAPTQSNVSTDAGIRPAGAPRWEQCDSDQLDKLAQIAVDVCLKDDRFQKHIAMVMEHEGLTETEWKFGDPNGDPISDLFNYREWLEDHKMEVQPEIRSALDTWDELEEIRLQKAAAAMDLSAKKSEAAPASQRLEDVQGYLQLVIDG